MLGNGHVRFGPEAVGKGPARGRHLANGLPVPTPRPLAGLSDPRLKDDDVEMTARRLVIVVTCLAVAVLGAVLVATRWDDASRVATVASALAAVAAVGVAVWAALPGSVRGSVAKQTGKATASGAGSRANSGVTGPATMPGSARADGTGDARATEGGAANSGVDLS
jgi:hypothetical protein